MLVGKQQIRVGNGTRDVAWRTLGETRFLTELAQGERPFLREQLMRGLECGEPFDHAGGDAFVVGEVYVLEGTLALLG